MAEVTVYNRYGEIIFKEKSSFKGWDGTYKGQPTPAGIYIYTIKLGAQQYLPLLKGTLTLIR
jgi:gliding motility-associated-like protein